MAADFMLSSSVETTKLAAPMLLATAALPGEVEMAVTSLPMALARRMPISMWKNALIPLGSLMV